ncbi:MAG: hypothetical protein HC913_08060, partial [Microscillaceae bacterium]|nr:hypothetical protein [Microscillaceae bacterium]
MKTFTRLFILIGCALSFQFSFAKTYNVANGDVAGLIRVMKEIQSNGDISNTINLGGGTYLLSAVYEFVNEGGTPYGSVGLPSLQVGKTLII